MTDQNQEFERVTKTLGQRIKNLRLQKGLSQMALAQLSSHSPPSFSKIEHGESNPSVSSLIRIAEALKISLSRLFQGLA